MIERRGRWIAWAVGLSLYGWIGAHAEPVRRLAVLELTDDHSGLEANALRILADAGRKAALSLDPRRYQVLTRESMGALLPEGTELAELCADGACEVVLGRRLGVDYVLSGAVTRLQGQLRVDLKLHETEAGRLLAAETGRGRAVEALEAAVLAEADGMFRRLPGVPGPNVHAQLDAKLSRLPVTDGAPDEAYAAQLERLEAARAAREQAEAEEAAARAAALARHTAEVDARWVKLAAQAEAEPGQGLIALRVFLEHYAAHPLGNPRQKEAESLRGRLAARIHAEEVAQVWDRTAQVAAGGGPEGLEAVRAFLGRYAGHPLGNPMAAEAEARLRALGGQLAGPGITWIRLPAGEFQMGALEGHADEQPLRTVRLRAFELGKTEVTVAQYRLCVEAGACTPPAGGRGCNWGQPKQDTHPINCVSWRQAQTFARWARARLPTEAEWEYAARSGGERVVYPWGEGKPSCRWAVFDLACGQTPIRSRSGVPRARLGTAPVCSRPMGNTAQGLCDMAGNVWEWVDDGYAPYLGAPTDGSAAAPEARRRVFRGGGWVSAGDRLRTTARAWLAPGERNNSLGFRVARTVPDGAP